MKMRCTFSRVILFVFGLHSCLGVYQPLQICEEGLVQVTSIKVLCDSQVSWSSYVRGSHRNSATCDYGDYANITITFDVTDNFNDEIYVQFDVYSSKNETLYASSPKSLCGSYDVPVCAHQGSYKFTTEVTFASSNGNATHFSPLVAMAFSREAEGKSDLGGVNIGECTTDGTTDNDSNEGGSGTVGDGADSLEWGGTTAIASYGLLAVLLAGGFAVMFFLSARLIKKRTIDKIDKVEKRRALIEKEVEPEMGIEVVNGQGANHNRPENEHPIVSIFSCTQNNVSTEKPSREKMTKSRSRQAREKAIEKNTRNIEEPRLEGLDPDFYEMLDLEPPVRESSAVLHYRY